MKKNLFIFSAIFLFFWFSVVCSTNAALITIGTATYGIQDYNLIYEDDQGLIWLDYTKGRDIWSNQVNWAIGLNSPGVLEYHLNPGISVSWEGDWRLPTTVDGPYTYDSYDGTTTLSGWNITTSEMGHLYYESLGNKAYYATDGSYPQPGWGFNNNGPFVNVLGERYYSGTEYALAPTNSTWCFVFYDSLDHNAHYTGLQSVGGKDNYYSTLVVRPGVVSAAPAVRYAKPAASGTGNCSSWAEACTLQTALTTAVNGDEIWAAAGTYKPTTGADRAATFQLKNGVALYGGFAGTETARIQRNLAVNATILSGDLSGDDVGFTNNSENVYHVVTGATGATLDGFSITAGNANDVGSGWPDTSCGGGMFSNSSSPTLTNLTFSGNFATYGGGMFNNSSSPALANVTFSGNSATYGAGMFNDSSSPALANVTFSGNSATSYGGGMGNWNISSPTLTNVTFSGNSATYYGGGMFNNSGSPSPQIRNTIFWDNTAPSGEGAQIFNNGSTSSVSDSVVQGGCPAGSTCTNIIATNPLLGTIGDYGGSTQTIPLLAGSSAIDTGNDATCAATDQRGISRPQGAHCDIGAYEYADTTAPIVTSIIRLNPSPTNLASVDFTVTFSEAVSGVDTSDFALTASGVSGAAVSGFSGAGSVYTVSVNTGTGNGTIRLDVPASATITDLAGNPLAGLPYTGGETYTVEKITWIYLPLIMR